ncbi:MAG TPA: matrixin family metalloprotease [Myxococcota bacterium]|nr:matrixin family metalloprotease [Myxococcota bacterium]
MGSRHPSVSLLALMTALLLSAPAGADWVKFGSGGWGSKWDDPVHPNPAVVTWGWMDDGTTVDPSFFIADEVVGGSDITQLRNSYDATYGAGAFDAAIQRALENWSKVAGITFVGPVADGGGAVGAPGATTPDIRIGAFEPVIGTGFEFVGAVGFGPPGDDLNFPDALAGDVMFNLAATFIAPAGNEGAVVSEFGNDLEGLALHELGHAAIGLGHPGAGLAEVMYVGAGCCTLINREPSPDDIAGAQSVYGLSATPACSNGIDDDADGRTDYQVQTGLRDFGCTDASDTSELAPAVACDDGLDNDGDGMRDYRVYPSPGDIGCSSHRSTLEAPQCQDGVNNDGLTGIDFDGGASANSGIPLDVPDPQCTSPIVGREAVATGGCGIGPELALLLPLIAAARRRRARAFGVA